MGALIGKDSLISLMARGIPTGWEGETAQATGSAGGSIPPGATHTDRYSTIRREGKPTMTASTTSRKSGYLIKLYSEDGSTVCTGSEPVGWTDVLFILWRTRRTLTLVHIERCGR
jgi:hypothetical protein